jgi:hypothetical protein
MRDAFDEKLMAAMHDAPVPAELRERILSRFRNEESAVARLRSRRRFSLVFSALTTAAALVLLAIWLYAPNQTGLSEQYVLDEAIRLFGSGVATQAGHLLADHPAPADRPFSGNVLQVRGLTWREMAAGSFSDADDRGIVYDLPDDASGVVASLYVVNATAEPGFGIGPSLHPFTTTGCCASAWQEGELLYVLVVQGDVATYRSCLNLPSLPLALLMPRMEAVKVCLNPFTATRRKV